MQHFLMKEVNANGIEKKAHFFCIVQRLRARIAEHRQIDPYPKNSTEDYAIL